MSNSNPDSEAKEDSNNTNQLPRIDYWEAAIRDFTADDVADPDGEPDDYNVTPRKRDSAPLAAPDDKLSADLFKQRYILWGEIDISDDVRDEIAEDVTIGQAREQQKRVVRYDIAEGDDGGLGRTEYQYARILRGDASLRKQQESTTTVLVTLRQSPLDSDDEHIPPVSLRDRLSVSWQQVRRSIRGKLNYRDLPHEYVAVVSGTERWATPHLHALYYVDDPDDDVTRELFEPAVEKHVDEHTNVTAEMHQLRPNGGAIVVQHDPELATGCSRWNEGEGRYDTPTKGAVYLATQLPRMLIAGEIRGDKSVPDTAWDTLVWSRASPKKSFLTSQGWPRVE